MHPRGARFKSLIMTDNDFDIVVAGGGVAGLATAAAFGTAGFSVLCVDPNPPVTEREAAGSDLRTTALLQPARRLLMRAGLWDALAPHVAPLQIMRIIDAGGPDATPRIVRDFNATDVSDMPFGWNAPNWLLRREMVARLDALDTVTFRPGISATDLFTRSSGARIRLSDGTKVKSRLVIAADGRHSKMRAAAGISVQTTRYGQKALAFAVTHDNPHENVSTEIHQTGGPFTLVPLPDHEGHPCSAIVWMDDATLSQERMDLSEAAFTEAVNKRSCGVLGPLRLASRRTIWPIISQRATELVSQRLALIAEAAHVVPPIGAQGLNMSLADTEALLDLAEVSPTTLGGADMLNNYERKRMNDILIRVTGIDMLNRASQMRAQPLRDARAMGLQALYAATPVRRMLMQMGLGTTRFS